MGNIMIKEMKLGASILSYLFIVFGFMFMLPGYPVLCGAFFVCLGLFQSFQNARETNDILFSALLPIAKRDVVKGKYLFVCFVEISSFILMTISVIIRMTVLADAPAYRSNALMNANLFALGSALVIFALFNSIFVGGFFKTAYKFAKPFLSFIISSFLIITVCEALHHIPGFEKVNSFGFDNFLLQILFLICGIVLFVIITYLSYLNSCKRFEKIDL